MEIAAFTILAVTLLAGIAILCLAHYLENKSPARRRNRRK